MFKATGGTCCNVNKAWAELSVEEKELVVRPKYYQKVEQLFLGVLYSHSCVQGYAM